MAKKKAAKAPSKSVKKEKAAQKVERKDKKKASKSRVDLSDEDDDQDLEGILDKVLSLDGNGGV
jgi:Zn-finger domain-containing protein